MSLIGVIIGLIGSAITIIGVLRSNPWMTLGGSPLVLIGLVLLGND